MIKDYCLGIQHLGIPTENFEGTIEFYEKLGFEKIYESKINETERVAFLRLHDLTIEIYENAEVAGKSGALDHIAINVADVEGVYKEVCEAGLNTMNDEIHYLHFFNGVRYFIIEGPNKEKVEFNQYL